MPWFIIFLGASIVFFRWANIKETTDSKSKVSIMSTIIHIMFAVRCSYVFRSQYSVFSLESCTVFIYIRIYIIYTFSFSNSVHFIFHWNLRLFFSRARLWCDFMQSSNLASICIWIGNSYLSLSCSFIFLSYSGWVRWTKNESKPNSFRQKKDANGKSIIYLWI